MPWSKSSLGVNWQRCTDFNVSKHPSQFDPLINKQYQSLTPIKMNKNGTIPYPFSAEVCKIYMDDIQDFKFHLGT